MYLIKTFKFNTFEFTSGLPISYSSYYLVSIIVTALKICHDTEHKEVGVQHISLNTLDSTVL